MTARNTTEAWNTADRLFPTDYAKDESASVRAGYPIYRSTVDGCNAYICDLGDRLEVNTDNGASINIWIEGDTQPTQPAERHEKTITLETTTHTTTANGETHTTKEASLTLSEETTLAEIANFARDAEKLIKEARKAAAGGAFVFVDAMIAHYAVNGYECRQTHFEMWSGYGDSITADGAHLNPAASNSDPAKDFWLTGKDILRELTI